MEKEIKLLPGKKRRSMPVALRAVIALSVAAVLCSLGLFLLLRDRRISPFPSANIESEYLTTKEDSVPLHSATPCPSLAALAETPSPAPTDHRIAISHYSTLQINDDNAEEVVEKLFGDDNAKRPKIALQLYLYDRFVAGDATLKGSRIVNSIYQPTRLFVKEVESVAVGGRFLTLMEERLHGLLAELADPDVAFRRTEDAKTCQWCDFKNICGR